MDRWGFRAFLLVATGAWVWVNFWLMNAFAPVDFYGDGAWYAQAILRWMEFGWPTTLFAGKALAQVGWSIFTPWMYFMLIAALFKLTGVSLPCLLSISITATGAGLFVAGLGMERLARPGPATALIYLAMLANPLVLAIAHTPRPDGMAMAWISICVFVALVARRPTLRAIAFLLLPLGYWIHPLSIIIPVCIFPVLLFYRVRARKFGPETAGLVAGLALVALVSLGVALAFGKFEILGLVEEGYRGISLQYLLKNLFIVVPLVAFVLFTATLPARGLGSSSERDIVRVVALGMIALPLILSMRPPRIYQFTFPVLFTLFYTAYLYIRRWKLLGFTVMALLLLGTGAYIWRSKLAFYTARNPALIASAGELFDRNRAVIDSADIVLFNFKGEAYLFWLLPEEKMITASRFVYQPLYGRYVVFLPKRVRPDYPCLVPQDSVQLGFEYSHYGAFGFSSIYLYRSREF